MDSRSISTAIETDECHPSIDPLDNIAAFDKAKLSKEDGNWKAWSSEMYIRMSLNGSWDYVTGIASQPDPVREPCAHANWVANDRWTCAFISNAISNDDPTFLSALPRGDAKAYWNFLEAYHTKGRPIDQVNLLLKAMAVKATMSESFTKGFNKICDLVDRAWAMDPNGVSLDTFKLFLVLNFFGGSKEFEAFRFSIHHRITHAPEANPYDAIKLREFIEDRQTIIDANKRNAL